MEFLCLISPIIAFAVNVISQVLLCRYMPKSGLLRSIYAGFAVGTFFFIFLEAVLSDSMSSFFAGFIAYSSLGYCYFHFLNLGETARRVRLLMELESSKDGLSLGELLERYNAAEITGKRVDRLLKSGQIVLRGDRFYIGNPVVLWMSGLVLGLKFILLGRRSELN